MGFATAIDDFSAGYAGLGLLAKFQPDLIKLDVALIRIIDTSTPRRLIVESVARLCDKLGIVIIADGVETVGITIRCVVSASDTSGDIFWLDPHSKSFRK